MNITFRKEELALLEEKETQISVGEQEDDLYIELDITEEKSWLPFNEEIKLCE